MRLLQHNSPMTSDYLLRALQWTGLVGSIGGIIVLIGLCCYIGDTDEGRTRPLKMIFCLLGALLLLFLMFLSGVSLGINA